jgi:hypothetical protein
MPPGTLLAVAKTHGIPRTRHRKTIAQVLEVMFNGGEVLPAVAILARAQMLDPTVTAGAVKTFLRRLKDTGLIEYSARHSVVGQISNMIRYELAQRRQAEAAGAGVSR